jgi:hypothetical protein
MNTNDPTTSIQSRDDFVDFVRDLSKDFWDSPDDWENVTVERYLEALAAWTHDMDGYYKNRGELAPIDINWKFIAQLLLAAKFYE